MITAKNLAAVLFLISVLSVTTISQRSKRFANLPTITYCQLVKDAALNDKRLVRVRGVYVVGFEGSLFYDATCESGGTWVEFDPSFETNTKAKTLKAFRRLADASPVKTPGGGTDHPERRVEIMAVGRFDGITPTYKLAGVSHKSGFGHNGVFAFQFTVLSIEWVKRVPKTAARRK